MFYSSNRMSFCLQNFFSSDAILAHGATRRPAWDCFSTTRLKTAFLHRKRLGSLIYGASRRDTFRDGFDAKTAIFEYFSPILMEVRSGPVQKYEHIYFFDRSQCARCKNEIKTRGLGRSGVPNNKSSPKSVPLDKAPSARMRKFTHFGAFNSLRSHDEIEVNFPVKWIFYLLE